MNFDKELERKTAEAEACIRRYLPPKEGFSGRLAQAMNYAMLAGGKRLRPLFLQESYRMLGGHGKSGGTFYGGSGNDPHPFPHPR